MRSQALAASILLSAICGCGWTPTRPFERNAPEVESAIVALDAGEAGAAAQLLEHYIGTGECASGSIGVPDKARERDNATFDLGLSLFHLAEQFGSRFGEEPAFVDGGPTQEQQAQAKLRSEQADCAIRLLDAIAGASSTPIDLEARARYLQGNLEFLRGGYKAAVDAYDKAIQLIPGVPEDAGDGIGRDAAWNRAIALQRIEDENKRDAGDDAGQDQDAPNDAPQDQDAGSQEAGQDGADDAPPPDAGNDAPSDSGGDDKDGGSDGGQDGPDPQNTQPEAGAPEGGTQPPPQNTSQDDRILDMLESAPTVQMQDAKNKAARRHVRGMVDK